MKGRLYTLFSVLFLLLCAVPVLGMFVLGPSQPGANEVLASKPVLLGREGWNTGYLSGLSDYVGDRFALRQELITANAVLDAALFHESASRDVILGEDGWLYFADTLADYEGTSQLSLRETWRVSHTLALLQGYVEGQGARFLFTVAPNKVTLYPEHMPERYPKAEGLSNWACLMRELDRQGVHYLDLFPVLSSGDGPLYYRTDTHWNARGSALACDAIVAALGGESALASEAFRPEPYLGDLYEMLYPAGTETEDGPVLARARGFSYVDGSHTPQDQLIRTESEGTLGSLLMFRDSFGIALHADLAEQFSSAAFSRAMPPRLDLLDGEETVIWELVERDLPRLLQNAPVFPSPRRELDAPEETVELPYTLERSPSAELPGLVRYCGAFAGGSIDGDSPVYMALDGAVYEASPVGSGGAEAFTLYAPPAEAVEVYVRSGGTWRRCE